MFEYIPINIAIYNITGFSSNFVDIEFNKNAKKIIFDNFGFFGLFLKSLNPIRNLFYSKYGN